MTLAGEGSLSIKQNNEEKSLFFCQIAKTVAKKRQNLINIWIKPLLKPTLAIRY